MSQIATLYKTRVGENPVETQLLRQLKEQYPVKAVKIENVLRLEYEGAVPEFDRLTALFCYPMAEKLTSIPVLKDSESPVIEISYQRAWTDPELSSILHAAEALGIGQGLKWARLATRYQLVGVSKRTAKEIAFRFLFNPQSQVIIKLGEAWSTLMPQGEHQRMEIFDLAKMSIKEMMALSDMRRLFFSKEQLLALQKFFIKMGRPASDGEIEKTAAYWGDHCKHTTWLSLGLLQALKAATRQINHPLVISAFEDNSGVMEFYGGWALCAKGETHISPLLGDTYGGIMTKHGGVQRDPLGTGQGAKPIVGSTIMATRDPRISWSEVLSGTFHPLITVRESIRGTKDYVNPMGISMGWSQYLIHPRNVKSFALGHSVGILPARKAKKGIPRPGDFVILIGGLTGNDGLHGATVSSSAGTAKTMTVDAAHVQIGTPIEQRIFMEAIPVLRDANCTRAITDCGAAGISCAVGELGSSVLVARRKLLSGVWINLAWVPLKCAGMPSWAIYLSESQERMVLAVAPQKLRLALEILADYGCRATVIGIFTDSEHCQAIYNPSISNQEWLQNPKPVLSGEVAVDLPYSFITGDCPLPRFKLKKPAKPKPFVPPVPKNENEWIELMQNLLGHYNICDQSLAAHQFDQTVQGGTVISYLAGKDERMPEEIFAKTPVLGKPWTVGVANAVNQLYGEINPAEFGKLVYSQAITKLVAAGFGPNDITCICNVYTPPASDPENAWRLSRLVKRGYVSASLTLDVPVISGKDSSSGRFVTDKGKNIDAPLTLDVLAMGRMPNSCRLIPKAFFKPDDALVLFHPGLRKIGLGGSLLFDLYGELGDELPKVDLAELKAGWHLYHQMLTTMRWSRYIHSRSVVAEGGLIRRLFEMSIGSGLGCDIYLPNNPLEGLFGELNTAVLIGADAAEQIRQKSLSWFLPEKDFFVLGRVIEKPNITVRCGDNKTLFSCATSVLAEKWQRTFVEVIR
ncbi:MAG: hypothetical protein C0410_13705 [Anaerolinea sp.]|nr:hypothetical protein [Anaerolinea sp.]